MIGSWLLEYRDGGYYVLFVYQNPMKKYFCNNIQMHKYSQTDVCIHTQNKRVQRNKKIVVDASTFLNTANNTITTDKYMVVLGPFS